MSGGAVEHAVKKKQIKTIMVGVFFISSTSLMGCDPRTNGKISHKQRRKRNSQSRSFNCLHAFMVLTRQACRPGQNRQFDIETGDGFDQYGGSWNKNTCTGQNMDGVRGKRVADRVIPLPCPFPPQRERGSVGLFYIYQPILIKQSRFESIIFRFRINVVSDALAQYIITPM